MGAGINEIFSDNPMNNIFGILTGTATWVQFPAAYAKLMRFKANPDNIGNFELANANGLGRYPLDAGDDTGWFAAPSYEGNSSAESGYYYRNLSGSTEYLHYWAQR